MIAPAGRGVHPDKLVGRPVPGGERYSPPDTTDPQEQPVDHSNDNVPRTFIAALHRVLTFRPSHPLHRAVLLAVGG